MDTTNVPVPPSARLTRSRVLVVLVLSLSAVFATGAPSDVGLAQSAATKYVGLEPFRLVDTRSDVGVQQLDENTWRVTAGGVGGVPADASAISVSMVATGAARSGFLLTYPAGTPLPDASNLNYEPGRTYSSGAIIPLNNGQFDVYLDSPTDFIVDVTGAFVPSAATRAGRFMPLDSPARAYDSRGGAPMASGAIAAVTLPSVVPADATAALLTFTSSPPNTPGFFTAFTGNAVPNTSALNVATANSARATTAIWPVAGRSLNVFSSAGGHLIVDVIGYFTGSSAPNSTEGLFVPMTPVRRLDTRQSAAIGQNQARSFQAPGGGVAVGSFTMVDPRHGGFGSLWANGTPMPPTSSINMTDGRVIANLGVTRVTSAGAAVFSSVSSHYLFDQFGYFTNSVANIAAPTAPDRPPAAGPPDALGCSVSVLLVPSCGIWFGAATGSRDGTFNNQLGLAEYEAVAQNTPDILHFYKTGPKTFPTSAERSMAQRPGLQRSLLLYNWKPSSKFTWRQTADGAADAEIATIAAGIKAYPHKLFLNIYHEPEENVIATAGSGMTPQDYAAMYRRVVTKLREAGVTNAVFVWNMMGHYGWASYLDALYPGDAYVDWVAYDPYIKNDDRADLFGLINFTFRGLDWSGYYNWVTAKAPGKPIMLAEWGMDLRTNVDPASKLNVDVNELARRYPMLKAMVYWNSRNDWVDVRLDDPSAKGLAYGAAFRTLAAHPVFNAMTPDSAP
jgi:hypothetical protein